MLGLLLVGTSTKTKKKIALSVLGLIVFIVIAIFGKIYQRIKRHTKFSGVFTAQSSTIPIVFPPGTSRMFSFRKSGFFSSWKFGYRISDKVSDYKDEDDDDKWTFADSYKFSNNDTKLVAKFDKSEVMFKKEGKNLIQSNKDGIFRTVWGDNRISDEFNPWDMFKSIFV